MPARFPSKCSSVSSILPTQPPFSLTWFNCARRTTTQLVMHLFTKLADAAIIWLAEDPPEGRATIAARVVPGHQPSNVTDQPHSRGMFQQKTTADSGLQSQLVAGSVEDDASCLFSSVTGFPAICSTCSTCCSLISAIMRCTFPASARGKSIQNVRFSRFNSVHPTISMASHRKPMLLVVKTLPSCLRRSWRTQLQPDLRHQ